MNLVLLHPEDFIDDDHVILSGRRFLHIKNVHQAEQQQTLKVGVINGLIGKGEIINISSDHVTLCVSVNEAPPPQLPLTLILALPRPKMLKRIFQTVATLGVKDLILINSYKVEKSYWQSPWLQEEKIREHLILGLEQGVATQLPQIKLEKRFKPFAEDKLPSICANKRALVAHPYNAAPCPERNCTDSVIAIGPEGGFIDYEIEKLQAAGMQTIELGSRILRVESVLPFITGRLF